MDDDCTRRSPSWRGGRQRAGRAARRRHNKRARLELTYSAGSGPATVFVKAVDPAHADLVALTSGLFHEPRLFSSEVVLPLDHPTVYAALIDEERSDFLMIMEDVVARGADPRDSTRPMTVAQVANGVRGLARLH